RSRSMQASLQPRTGPTMQIEHGPTIRRAIDGIAEPPSIPEPKRTIRTFLFVQLPVGIERTGRKRLKCHLMLLALELSFTLSQDGSRRCEGRFAQHSCYTDGKCYVRLGLGAPGVSRTVS